MPSTTRWTPVALALSLSLALAPSAAGQTPQSTTPADSTQHHHSMEGMPGMEGMEGMPGMHASGHSSMTRHPLGFTHARFGSGTSWLPDATPTRHLMTRAGSWSVMGHGMAFVGAVGMNGPRGDRKAFLPNMVMVMAERGSSSRTFWRIATMFSADAATVGGAGYPLVYQTGETWHDRPLHDHQHPHNVFSELSASVTRALSASVDASLYAAPVGEPALGPPSFPHRPVGGNDPLAPIGHHWQDATHIAYGVATAGIESRAWRIEASSFNGLEPGENRAEVRGPKFDSFSARASVNPTRCLSLQASHGYLHRPEPSEPDHDSYRTTASAIWVRPLGGGRSVDATVVWGRNRIDRRDYDSWLFEAETGADRGLTPFARLEYVEKNAEELVLGGSVDPERTFPLRQATIGAVYDLPVHGSLAWGIGGQTTQSLTPHDLEPYYGKNPGGWALFLRIRPRATAHMAAM